MFLTSAIHDGETHACRYCAAANTVKKLIPDPGPNGGCRAQKRQESVANSGERAAQKDPRKVVAKSFNCVT